MSYVKHKIKTSTGLELAKNMRERKLHHSPFGQVCLCEGQKKKYLKDSACVTEDKFNSILSSSKTCLIYRLLYIPLPKTAHADPSQVLALACWATQALLVCLYQQES